MQNDKDKPLNSGLCYNNQVVVNNSYLSAFLYFTGLGMILLAGYFYQKALLYLRNRK